MLPDDQSQSPDAEVQHRELETLTRAWLSRLSDKHRHVIERRFGLNNIEPATLEELADEMGLTRERVRQIQQGSAGAAEAVFCLQWRSQGRRSVKRGSVTDS